MQNTKTYYLYAERKLNHFVLLKEIQDTYYIDCIHEMKQMMQSSRYHSLKLIDSSSNEVIFSITKNHHETYMNHETHYKHIPQPDIEMLEIDQYEKKYE